MICADVLIFDFFFIVVVVKKKECATQVFFYMAVALDQLRN